MKNRPFHFISFKFYDNHSGQCGKNTCHVHLRRDDKRDSFWVLCQTCIIVYSANAFSVLQNCIPTDCRVLWFQSRFFRIEWCPSLLNRWPLMGEQMWCSKSFLQWPSFKWFLSLLHWYHTWVMGAMMVLIFFPWTPPFLAYAFIRFAEWTSSSEKNFDCKWIVVILLNSVLTYKKQNKNSVTFLVHIWNSSSICSRNVNA